MSYYKKFGIVLRNPLFGIYIRWAYRTCITDLEKLGLTPNFSKHDFTALLCGVGNENTANEFIKFVIDRNSKAKIIIIDIADEQIKAVEKLVRDKYSKLDIKVKQIDALKVNTFLAKSSIDWIETDGFLEYFDKKSLERLLQIWKRILEKDGFITFRDCVIDSAIEQFIDKIKIRIAKLWLGITVYTHTKKDLEGLLEEIGFRFIANSTFLPTFRRYSVINKNNY